MKKQISSIAEEFIDNNTHQPLQWYVVNTFSGNEDGIIENIKSKVNAYGMSNLVQDIRVVKEIVKEDIEVKKQDLPKTLRNSKTTKWTVLANGNYKKTIVKERNKYSGYVFVKMIMNDETWFLIRNTPGVTGFIGSSGKGTKPFPVTIDEILSVLQIPVGSIVTIIDGPYKDKVGTVSVDILTDQIEVEIKDGTKIPVEFFNIQPIKAINETHASSVLNQQESQIQKMNIEVTVKKIERMKAHFEVGNTITIKSGQMEGMQGIVSSINDQKGTAMIDIDMFGRSTSFEVNFEDVEIK